MRSTLEEYLLWMSKSGNKRKVGGERLPAEPLSPRTSVRHLKKTRTVLREARENPEPSPPLRRFLPRARDRRARKGPRIPAVARSPARVLHSRDDALSDAMARDALPRGR